MLCCDSIGTSSVILASIASSESRLLCSSTLISKSKDEESQERLVDFAVASNMIEFPRFAFEKYYCSCFVDCVIPRVMLEIVGCRANL